MFNLPPQDSDAEVHLSQCLNMVQLQLAIHLTFCSRPDHQNAQLSLPKARLGQQNSIIPSLNRDRSLQIAHHPNHHSARELQHLIMVSPSMNALPSRLSFRHQYDDHQREHGASQTTVSPPRFQCQFVNSEPFPRSSLTNQLSLPTRSHGNHPGRLFSNRSGASSSTTHLVQR